MHTINTNQDYQLFSDTIKMINNLANSIVKKHNVDKRFIINHIISALPNNEDYNSIIYKIVNNIQPTALLDEQTMSFILNNSKEI